MKALPLIGAGLLASAALLSFTPSAEAANLIKQPNAHPDYSVELEPHFTMGLFTPNWGPYGRGGGRYYRGRGYSPDFGGGFRASIPIVDPGFIPKLNNTVAITFGLDLTNCRYCYNNAPQVFLPEVGLQWNFFFTEKFSAFGDVGFMLRNDGFYRDVYPDFFLMFGGRYHFNDKIALTGRIGYPFFTIGVSFFL